MSSLQSPPRPRRVSQGFRASLVAFENSALDIHEDRRTRSIGGRLSGSIRLIPLADEVLSEIVDADTEEARLLKPGVPAPSPKLTVWIFPALTCASAYAFYNIFIKKGSFTINPILGGVVLQFVAAILGTVLMGGILLCGVDRKEVFQYDKKGMQWSVCAGLAVGTAEMLSFCVSGMGVPATHSIPIIIGGSVMFGAVLGMLLLGEKLMLWGWSGIAMLVTGIAMVATDPGEKVEEGTGSSDSSSPPLLLWIAPALICASAYAFYNIFIKLGSASINPILGGVVLQFVAALFGTVLLGVITIKEGGTDYLNYDRMGLIWACAAGIAVGTAEMLSFIVSGMGVPATQSIPTIIGGSVMFGAVFGLIMLGETLMYQGWLGVALLMTGIGFVATDPGEKMAGH